jgi:hypothetical protein
MNNAYDAPRSRRGSFSSPYLASDAGYPTRERRHSFNSMRPSTPNPSYRAPSPNLGYGTPNLGYGMPIPQTRSHHHYGSPSYAYDNSPNMSYGSVPGNGIYGSGLPMQPSYSYANPSQNIYPGPFPTQSASSIGYANAPGTMTTVPPGSTIVIPGKSKRHHHHSGSRHHRSRSQSIVIPGGYAGSARY